MKIVITGGLGFIGSNFARYVRSVSNDVKLHCIDWAKNVFVPSNSFFYSVTSSCFASEGARSVYEHADAVVHLAASTTVQGSIADPIECFSNNVTKTHTLLEHVRSVAPNCHFVFASTGGAIVGDHDGLINENVPPQPKSPYGASKLAVEGLLSAYSASYGIPTCALRFSNVYGPNSGGKSSVVAKFCKSLQEGCDVTINGDGCQTRDFVHVDDICTAIWKVIKARETGVFQLGTGTGTSINELVRILQAGSLEKQISVLRKPNLAGEVRHNVCDFRRARRRLGYEPQIPIQQGLIETLGWFRSQQAEVQKNAKI